MDRPPNQYREGEAEAKAAVIRLWVEILVKVGSVLISHSIFQVKIYLARIDLGEVPLETNQIATLVSEYRIFRTSITRT